MPDARLALPLLAALVLAASGCGSDGATDGAGAGAEIAPASTSVFVSIANDPDGEQWQRAEELLGRFPSGGDAVAEFHEGLEEQGLDFEQDVRPALGPEVDLVVLDVERAQEEEGVVVLTQPPDEARLRALVERSDGAAYELVDEWAVIAESEAALAAFQEARGDESLAETEAWRNATDELPEDALVRGFVNGDALTRAAAETTGAGPSFLPGRDVPSLGFAVRAEEDGIRFDVDSRVDEETAPEPYEASLPDDLPAGALAYLSWSDAAEQIRQTLREAGDQNPEIDRYVAQGELALGVSLERDLLPLFDGEGALAVYPAEAAAADDADLPAIVLALAVEDEQAALETLDRIVERASAFLGSVEATEGREIGGVTVRAVSLDTGEILYTAFDGKLVVASASGPLEQMLGEAAVLSEDEAYAAARDAAEAPDETIGFAYANVDAILAAFAAEAPPEARANLEPLGAVFVHATRDDEETAVDGFLGID